MRTWACPCAWDRYQSSREAVRFGGVESDRQMIRQRVLELLGHIVREPSHDVRVALSKEVRELLQEYDQEFRE